MRHILILLRSMKILIFGATSATGTQLVQQALDQQFVVTAFVRDVSKLTLQHPRLRVVTGDIRVTLRR